MKLLECIGKYMALLQPDDWAVIMDGDIAFLRSDFGHQVQNHINRNPDAGLLTCFASRCHYPIQLPPGADIEKDSILWHKQMAESLATKYHRFHPAACGGAPLP